MNNIKLKVKLSAYTKGIIPDVSKFIEDAPADNKIYGRENNTWTELDIPTQADTVVTEAGSGIDIDKKDYIAKISVRQQTVEELPDDILDDMTYYVIEKDRPDIYLVGGTAYSSEENEYIEEINGGTASTTNFNFIINPLTSKGE